MLVRPHLTDRDLELSQEEIVALQREDVALLREYGAYFAAYAQEAAQSYGARVVILCNVETEEIVPSPLDWEGQANVLGLDPPIYRTAKHALEHSCPPEEVIVLLYRPQREIVSIYTVAPAAPRDNVGAVLGDR
ncbi:MAG: hypothetical protein KatS3mg115_1124 [Candidatus Poribacteria bacterium]|nr:MAG: hypothetical protein KatS3mg115_1124 [Candidatus Poribacteria bacterium]